MSASAAYYIVVVSDDSGTDRQLRHAFKQSAPECNVGVVRSRGELDALHPPSLIILDLMLSHEAPFDVLRWLRTEPRYQQVPVFVLGSEIVDHEIDEAYALGANSCFLTETEPQGLERIVRAMVTYVGLVGTPGCASFA
jgi:DNA-binding response OmpR family regulator